MPLMTAGSQVFDTRMTMSRSRYARWENCAAFSKKTSESSAVSGKAVVCRRNTWSAVIVIPPRCLSSRY